MLKKQINILLVKVASVLSLTLMQFVLAKKLSVNEFGVYSFIMSLNLIAVAVVVWGLDKYSIKIVSISLSDGKGVSPKYFRNVLKVIVVNGMICAPIYLVILFFGLRDDFDFYVAWISLVLLFSGAFALVSASVTKGVGRVVISEFGYNVVRPVMITLLVTLTYLSFKEITVVQALAYFLLSYVVVGLILTYASARELGRFNVKSDAGAEYLYRVGVPFLIMGLGQAYLTNIDILLVGLFLDTTAVANYSLASKLVGMVLMGLVAANMLIMPKIASLYKNDRLTEMRALIKANNVFIAIITLPIVLVILFFNQDIINFINSNYSQASSVVEILLIGQVVNILSGPVILVCAMAGQQITAAKLIFGMCVLQTFISYIAIPVFGIIGAAYVNVLVNILLNLSLLFVVVYKIKINPSFFLISNRI